MIKGLFSLCRVRKSNLNFLIVALNLKIVLSEATYSRYLYNITRHMHISCMFCSLSILWDIILPNYLSFGILFIKIIILGALSQKYSSGRYFSSFSGETWHSDREKKPCHS